MRTLLIGVCAALVVLWAYTAPAYIVDPFSRSPISGPYTFNDYHNGGSTERHPQDNRFGMAFETYGMDVSVSGTNKNTFTFILYTDFSGSVAQPVHKADNGVWDIYYADIFFSTDGNPYNFEYALMFARDGYFFSNGALNTYDTVGGLTGNEVGLYALNSTSDVLSSYMYAQAYGYSGIEYNSNRAVKTADSAQFLSGADIVSITLTDQSGGTKPDDDVPNYIIEIVMTINDAALLAAFQSGFDVYWGTGTCANDPVQGRFPATTIEVIPIPPSLLLLGSGLLGFIGFSARRRRKDLH